MSALEDKDVWLMKRRIFGARMFVLVAPGSAEDFERWS
jgi:hypothetical protein